MSIRRPGLTELAASKFVESHGGDALGILGERAALAEERGHTAAATTWRNLASAAAGILGACPSLAAGNSAARAAWRASVAAGLRGPRSRV
jgi:hypothetical protein